MNRIEEIRAREKAATPGPWTRLEESGDIVSGLKEQSRGSATFSASICEMQGEGMVCFDQLYDAYHNGDPIRDEDGEDVDMQAISAGDRAEYNWPWDGDFIAHARADIPHLLEVNEALVKALTRFAERRGPGHTEDCLCANCEALRALKLARGEA